MKITCLKKDLDEAVSIADKITGKNLNLPVLKGILFDVGNSIVLKSTNLDLGLEINIPGKIESKGKFVVLGGLLNSFLSSVQNEGNITLELKGNKLSVIGKNTRTSISTIPNDDFPLIPKPKTKESLNLKPEIFINGLRSVWFSASNSSIKPELSSVYIYPDGEKIVYVATDSFRLAEKRIVNDKALNFEPVLIPIKNVPEIIRFLEEAQGNVEVFFEESQVSFSFPNHFLTSRVVDGSFPDYKQIIPKEFLTEAVLLKEDILNSLKVANIFADKFNQIVFELSPSKKSFVIKSQNQEKGENTGSLQATLTGDDITIGFNFRYVMDVFQSIPSDSLSLSLLGFGKPMLIKGVPDDSFTYVIMPMNK